MLTQLESVSNAVTEAEAAYERVSIFHIPGLTLGTPLGSVGPSKRGTEPLEGLKEWAEKMVEVPLRVQELAAILEQFPQIKKDSDFSKKLSELSIQLHDHVLGVFGMQLRLLIPSQYLEEASQAMWEVVQSSVESYELYNIRMRLEPEIRLLGGIIEYDFHLVEDNEWQPSGKGTLRDSSALRASHSISWNAQESQIEVHQLTDP
ncbi:MAG: hypothetical protein AB1540_12720 [Bdellovibrionota bacterium]